MISVALINAISDTLAACRETVYVEPRSPFHDKLTASAWKWVRERVDVVYPGAPVLDIGCGEGPFLDLLEAEGIECVGITANKEEFEICDKRGLVVMNWDAHDVSQLTNYGSGIWLRHMLEHSPMPYVLLRSCCNALKDDGWIYVEVPAPGTSSKHEDNVNHFSVFNQASWMQLISRAGFKIIETASIRFETVLGQDEYFSFLAKKSAA